MADINHAAGVISGIGESGNETTALDDITIEWKPMD